MSEEIFDIVDQYDRVIGQHSRGKIHQLGLRHRSVSLLVFNDSGQLFLQKRSMKKDYAPGKWGASVSGHVDTGEDYDTAIVREAREELGIILPEIPKKLFKLDACRQTEQEFVWIYEYQYQGPFQLHPEEVSDGRWFSIREVNQWIASRTEDLAKFFIFIWEMREQKMRKVSTIIS